MGVVSRTCRIFAANGEDKKGTYSIYTRLIWQSSWHCAECPCEKWTCCLPEKPTHSRSVHVSTNLSWAAITYLRRS